MWQAQNMQIWDVTNKTDNRKTQARADNIPDHFRQKLCGFDSSETLNVECAVAFPKTALD
jgi:hypothetical protein